MYTNGELEFRENERNDQNKSGCISCEYRSSLCDCGAYDEDEDFDDDEFDDDDFDDFYDEDDGLQGCEYCGTDTRGRLCNSCQMQENIDNGDFDNF